MESLLILRQTEPLHSLYVSFITCKHKPLLASVNLMHNLNVMLIIFG